MEHIRLEYPGCVGVQAKNEEVPQITNSGIFGANYRKINYFAHYLSRNLPEDNREAYNNLMFNHMDFAEYNLTNRKIMPAPHYNS